MSDKVLYQNTTQVSNYILDNLELFDEGQIKVILLITRKTIGWHKETDFIRGSQIILKTGLSKPTISKAVNSLIKLGILVRMDNKFDEIKEMPQGYRGEINYSLNKDLTTEQLVKNFNQLNNFTSTGKESLPYKTNSIQNSNTFTKVNETSSTGMKKLGDVIRSLKGANPVKSTPHDKRIAEGWQHYAHEVVELAGFKNGGRARIFQAFKSKNYGYPQMEKAKQVIKHKNYLDLKTEDDRVRYLMGAFRHG